MPSLVASGGKGRRASPSPLGRALPGILSVAVAFGCNEEPHKIGPYLQTVTRDTATIVWETSLPLDSRVDYGPTTDYGQIASAPAQVQLHEMAIGGLSAETLYHYRVSSGNDVGLDHTFRTAVHESTPFRFAVYGDTQENFAVHGAIAGAILAENPSFVLHAGDEILRGNTYESWFTEFFNPGRDLMSEVPVYVAIGNHEEDAAWFYYYHSYPAPEDYYAFGFGNSYFVMVDSNKDYSPGSPQYVWLEQTLASPEAQDATWLFVTHHHPAYSEGWNPCNYDGDPAVRQHLVPLMETYGVDAVFNGHMHGYERGSLNGVTTVITGGGGGWTDHHCQDWPHVTVAEYIHHYLTVDIEGATMTLRAHRSDGIVFDNVRVRK